MADDNAKIVIEAEDKASAQMRKLADEAEKQFNRWDKLKTEQLQQLELEKTLLYEGAEAAEALKLQQQGLDAETAKFIARERALIQEQKKLNEELDKTGVKLPAAFKETKAASGFLGQLSSFAGGGVLSSLTNDVASLTGRVSAFNKAAAAGEAATMGMKLGITAAVAAASVKVGAAIGDWVFETQRWNDELDAAIAATKRLDDQLSKVKSQRFADDMSFINLMPQDDADREMRQMLERLNNELQGTQNQAAHAEAKLKELQQWQGYDWTFSLTQGGELSRELEMAQDVLETRNKTADAIREQITQIERQLGIERELEQRRREVAEAQQSQSFIETLQEQLIAVQHELEGTIDLTQVMKNTIAADRETAVALLEEIEATKQAIAERAELEKQKETEAKAEEQRLQRIQDLQQRELDRLTEQRILLEQGAEAAKRWRLEKEGLSGAMAAAIAAEQAELDRMREELRQSPTKERSVSASLQAVESRLLTRGSSDDPSKQIQSNTAQLVIQQGTANNHLQAIAAKTDASSIKLESPSIEQAADSIEGLKEFIPDAIGRLAEVQESVFKNGLNDLLKAQQEANQKLERLARRAERQEQRLNVRVVS